MEDSKLKEYFSKVIKEIETRGHSPLVVRESFDAVAPKLIWQRSWLLFPIILAGMVIGTFLPALAILASSFYNGWLAYGLAFVLISSGSLLLYFSLSAFTFNEERKWLGMAVISLIVAGAASAMRWGAVKLIDQVTGKITEAVQMVNGLASGKSIGTSVLSILQVKVIETWVLIAIIILAYNLWPFIFYISERLLAKREMKLVRHAESVANTEPTKNRATAR